MIQGLVGFGATAVSATAGHFINKAARKATAKAIKPENFSTKEEFEKAYTLRSLRNGVIGGVATVITAAGVGVGASYVICDLVPEWNRDQQDNSDDESAGEAAALI